jgi:homoserine O-acetyltransferase/O-succinyltransferase
VTTPSFPGVWLPGDDPGQRQFAVLTGRSGAGFTFEGGGRLDEVTVAFETWGELSASADNAILVLHALTGDAHAVGPPGDGHPTAGWWDGLIGPGAPLDTDRYYVVCPNVLGGCQGTTGPSSLGPGGTPYGSHFPVITIRDQVAVEVALAAHLGIERWACVAGGSMGGMRALEWCVGQPEQVARAIILAVGAAATADQMALCALQIRAIRSDPAFQGGDYYASTNRPLDGLSIARGLGQFTYRTGREFEQRFGRDVQGQEDPLKGGRYAIESYLQHQGAKLGERFDPNAYVTLSEAMNHHDVGRGRGGIAGALQQVQAQVTVAGIVSDRLYPLALQEEMVRHLPGHPPLSIIESQFGHDGFLLETEQVGQIMATALNSP